MGPVLISVARRHNISSVHAACCLGRRSQQDYIFHDNSTHCLIEVKCQKPHVNASRTEASHLGALSDRKYLKVSQPTELLLRRGH